MPVECLLATRGRREFLKLFGAGTLGRALPGGFLCAQGAGPKPLRGIFPIAQTPFTAGGKLDVDGLARISRSLTNARMMRMFMATARSLLSAEDSMATPCSVKA
ncbi:MAG: hypothetical protein ABSG26_20280 [Bryobacteraceae bacterium]|jgi:hypothetical protein